MSREFEVPTSPPITSGSVYVVLRNELAQPYNTSSQLFEEENEADWPLYAIDLALLGAASGYWAGDFPTAITQGGTYTYLGYQELGTVPSVLDDPVVGVDGVVEWDGQQEVIDDGTEYVSLSDMKLHLRELLDDQNSLISAYIAAARAKLETDCQRTFRPSVSRVHHLMCFPDDPGRYYDRRFSGRHYIGSVIELPYPPVLAVQSVTYYDPDGVLQTLATNQYITDLSSAYRARIALAPNCAWPSTQDRINAISINYTTGSSTADAMAVHAIKLLVGHWYANRSAVEPGILAEVPQAYEALMWSLRTW